MRSSEIFSFIRGMFENGTLPRGRNLWGIAYNVHQYPAAINAAAQHGVDKERFEFWLNEYARRSKPEAALMLPVIVRWGLDERPQRMQVQVPIYTMKDFDSLQEATEAALMWALDADAGAELWMRPMRAPDVPDVWASVEVRGEKMEVSFNPVKLWRGEVSLGGNDCGLKQVGVFEWRVVEKEPEVRRTRRAQASAPLVMNVRAVPPVQAALPPVPQPRRRKGRQESQSVVLAVVLAAVALLLFWMMVS